MKNMLARHFEDILQVSPEKQEIFASNTLASAASLPLTGSSSLLTTGQSSTCCLTWRLGTPMRNSGNTPNTHSVPLRQRPVNLVISYGTSHKSPALPSRRKSSLVRLQPAVAVVLPTRKCACFPESNLDSNLKTRRVQTQSRPSACQRQRSTHSEIIQVQSVALVQQTHTALKGYLLVDKWWGAHDSD